MITFMIWPHEDDAALRAAYLPIVGETIEDEPRNNGTHFLIGSSRLNSSHFSAITAAVPSTVFYSAEPEGWS